MAKGSGMIEPMMATMLAFVTTDAGIPGPLLERALREVVNDTFNAITVDGDSSTNDCVMIFANGASGVTVDEHSYDAFTDALRSVCLRLALGIVRGGEGAAGWSPGMSTARHRRRSPKAAKAIANPLLVKTAIRRRH
jgi:glutamate N-acetyltransferase/amino-acid N-acetyltransferase